MLIKVEKINETKSIVKGFLNITYEYRVKTPTKAYVCEFNFNLKNEEYLSLTLLREAQTRAKLRNRMSLKKHSEITNEINHLALKEQEQLKMMSLLEYILFRSKEAETRLIHATDGLNNLIYTRKIPIEYDFFCTFNENGYSLGMGSNNEKLLEQLEKMALLLVKKESREKEFISF